MLIVVGAGVAYLILNPPSDLIRQTIADQVKQKTGRDLVVSGPAAFSFYPGLGVSLKDVTLSGPPGSPHKLASIGELDVNIKTMPLINRQIEVRRLILRKPVFDLRVDKQGRKNWQFAGVPALTRMAQAAPEGTANDAAPAEAVPAESAPAESAQAGGGQAFAVAVTDEFQRDALTGAYVPRKVRLQWPRQQFGLEIDLGTVRTNENAAQDPSNWTMPTFEGTMLVNLADPRVRIADIFPPAAPPPPTQTEAAPPARRTPFGLFDWLLPNG